MNVLYLFGNGFDVNLGLKTSYKDFYNYLLSNKETILSKIDANIRELMTDIFNDIMKYLSEKDNIINWADFELAMAEFYETKEISHESYVELVDILSYELSIYLETEDQKFKKCISQKEINVDKFYNQLITPHLECPNTVKPDFINMFSNSLNINFITFNYTFTLDYLLENKREFVIESKKHIFNKPIHIHGTLNDNIFIGVDNVNQLKNPKLIPVVQEYPELYFKPQMNVNSQRGADNSAYRLIDNAEVIILFGLSLGDTDLTWWRKIGNWYTGSNKRRIIIFNYDENIKTCRSFPKKAYIERLLYEKILFQLGVNSNGPAEKNRIILINNTNSFMKNMNN